MNSTNNLSARATYQNARQMFYDAWIGSFGFDSKKTWDYIDSLVLAPSEIRLEVELNTANNSFAFGVTPNQANSTGVVFNTENRLNLQDNMVVSEYGIFVAQPTSRTDVSFQLNTFANSNVFAVADSAALNTTFYSNGYFETNVNNYKVIVNRGLFNHWYIPQTQQIAALGATAVKSQIRGAEDGFVTQEPNFIISGQKNTIPKIVLPGALASAAAFMRCVLIYRGILAQNSTVVS